MYNQFVEWSTFIKILFEDCAIERSRPILVAVSGGPDSLCLLDMLYHLDCKVIAAHFDHGLRSESVQDAYHVEGIARQMGIPYVSDQQDVGRYAHLNRLTIEEAARKLRYQFLFSQAIQFNVQAVAVGHTADDQVETVLLHLLRGSGLTGLRGMSYRSIQPEWNSEIPIVRPLLNTWREDTLGYCREKGLTPVFDASNLDTTMSRNRIRHELIPVLAEYNAGIKAAIWRMAQILAGEYQVVEKSGQEALEDCLVQQGANFIVLRQKSLQSLSVGLQRTVLRQTLAKLRPGLREFDFSIIERAVEFIRRPSRSKKIQLAQGLILELRKGSLFLAEETAQPEDGDYPFLAEGAELTLTVPGSVALQDNWSVESEMISPALPKALSGEKWDPNQAWVALSSLESPLTVRTRRPGDRFEPLGMEGHSVRLSDFFINLHLPKHARDHWPLVCSGGKIVWVAGYRMANFCRLHEKTDQVLLLRLVRNASG